MENNSELNSIENKIITIRGQQVLLDRDLAALYQVTTKRLNEQVKRNIQKFPSDFMFQLTQDEWASLRSQNATFKSKRGQHRKYFNLYSLKLDAILLTPGILNSDVANARSIFIHRAFVAMKNQIFSNPNYELLREKLFRLQAETKLFNAKTDTLQAEMLALKKLHKLDLNVQNMEINDLNEKMNELLTVFNTFKDSSIIIKKDNGIGEGKIKS